jgi:hypothetical protein
MYYLPIILNVIAMVYLIFNAKIKYNIIYFAWVVFSWFPIFNWLSFVVIIVFKDDIGLELKKNKINKFLFGIE